MSWSEQFPPNEDSYYDHMFLKTPIGIFRVEWKSWKDPCCDYTIYLAPTDDLAATIYIDSTCDLESAQKCVMRYLVRIKDSLIEYLKLNASKV